MLLANDDGTILRLKDVAEIELGSESYAYKGYTNGHPGVSTMIFQTAGSNATQVVEDIEALLDEVRAELPKGVEIAHLQSVNDFLYASINEVIKTLIEAIILVVLVVYVFLQDIRSTIIPTVSILVALIGTFAFLSVAGFSINLLTLFALVLAIGTVVDDAIMSSRRCKRASTPATVRRSWPPSTPCRASRRPSSPRRWSSWPYSFPWR